MLKRFFDVICAAIGIIILLPILVVIAVLIIFDSGVPVFYLQERVGLHGKVFNILKFRTMYKRDNAGLSITVGDDSRITRIGYYLRKFKLDELPQLINVLRGDMSLVGPRPEVLHYVNMYPEAMKNIVLSVRPGITDYASIYMIDESSLLGSAPNPELCYINEIMPVKLDYAIKYVKNKSIMLDIYLIFLTLYKIIKR